MGNEAEISLPVQNLTSSLHKRMHQEEGCNSQAARNCVQVGESGPEF